MRAWAGLVVLALFCTALSACDDEPAQRAAFKEFLQSRIVARQGIHIPVMRDDTAKSFGPYARDYQVILDFNSGMDLPVLARFEAIRRDVHDLGDMVANRAELTRARDAVPAMIALNQRQLDTADSAHAAMRHPPDLKPIYDQAFDRIVTGPGKLLGEMLPLLRAQLGAMVEVADFLAVHASQVQVYALTAEIDDDALKGQLRRLVAALHDRDDQTNAMRARFQKMVGGG